ncbi:MAG TPA: DUF3987 domain-containing protein [Desulfatiglandales bacterium]|nr:DUF3987 domain-containing protein [Desulfatiglandales bacterium]
MEFNPNQEIPKELLRAKVEEHKQFYLERGFGKQEVIENANWLREQVGLEGENEKYNPLEFPPIMDGVAGTFARIYASHLEVPEHFLYMGFLTCLGSILADRVSISSELDTRPRLYTVLLGESADDRKSTAIQKTVDFFRETLTKESFSPCWGVGSAEGLQARLSEGKKAEDPKNLLLCFDEFKLFVSKCQIETSVLLPCVNSLFEMTHYEAHTKKTSVKVENAHLSIIAASTVQTWERIWTPAFTDIGFYNRLWLVPGTGERKFSLPSKIPNEEKINLKHRLVGILQMVGDGLELNLTEEAKELYQSWYMELEQSIHTKRLDTYTLRLMPLLALNESKDKIDLDIVKMVIALADWQLEVRRLHDPVEAENNTAKLEERIRRVLKAGPKADRELKQSTHANRLGLWFYSTAINNLRKAKEIAWNKEGKCWQLL